MKPTKQEIEKAKKSKNKAVESGKIVRKDGKARNTRV